MTLSPKQTAAFERYRRIAAKRGGKLLATGYVDSQTKMAWECEDQHVWEATGNSIQQGSWCPTCAGVVLTLADLRLMALDRGGKCLSTKYEGIWEHYLWECKDGHRWTATAEKIRHHDTWCPTCARQSQYTIDDLHALAARFKGVCLSTRVTTIHDHYRWRCELGHVFTMTAHGVQQGHFCMRCRGRLPDTLARLQRIARRKGGKVLSDYVNATTKIHLECKQEHRWWTMPHLIIKGHWCALCNRGGHSTAPLSIETMRAMAKERGGACLSTTYVNLRTPLEWRCAFRHEWTATGGSIRHGHTWCPTCAWRYPGTLDGMQRLAADRNGKCLSTECNSHRTMLVWQCERRHRFEATAMAARSGVWCPRCVT